MAALPDDVCYIQSRTPIYRPDIAFQPLEVWQTSEGWVQASVTAAPPPNPYLSCAVTAPGGSMQPGG